MSLAMSACPLCEELVAGDGYCALCGDADGFATFYVPREIAAAYRLGGLTAARDMAAPRRRTIRDHLKRVCLFGLSFRAPRKRPQKRAFAPKPAQASVGVSAIGAYSPWDAGPGGEVQLCVGSGAAPDGLDGVVSVDVLQTGRYEIRSYGTLIVAVTRDRVWIRGLTPAMLTFAGVAVLLGAVGGALLARLW